MSSVIFFDGSKHSGLLLTSIERKDGKIVEGHVSNGSWLLKLDDTTAYACATEYGGKTFVVNKWTYKTITEIPVPKGMKGDYNVIIHWAEKELEKETGDHSLFGNPGFDRGTLEEKK
jgi:hypothetical protein